MNEQITVRVTRDDIRKGVKDNSVLCPIATALRRKGYERIKVHTYQAQIGRGKVRYELPEEATRFIDNFDEGVPVKPSVFTLTKEIIE